MPPKKRKRAEASPAQVGIAVEASGALQQFASVLGRHKSFLRQLLAAAVRRTRQNAQQWQQEQQ